jgi:hypothetical protein
MARSLSLVPLAQLSLLAGQEHGRTIPLPDITENIRQRIEMARFVGLGRELDLAAQFQSLCVEN